MSIGVFAGNLKARLLKRVAEAGSTNIFLLLLLAVITFYPLLSVGFTTHDDARIAIDVWDGNIWEVTKSASGTQGRFVFFWDFPLSAVPYAIDSRIWYLTTKFTSFFLLLSALYFAVAQLFKSKWIALVSLALFLSLIQNGWEHNVLTSYPVVFNLLAVFFLVSLGLFATAIDRKNLALAWLSGGLYFLALGTELFVLFFPFYVAVLLSRAAPDEPVIRRLVSGKKYLLAIALPLMAYLAIYLAWRHIHPSTYDGNSLDGLNLLAAAKVVATYSLNAFPLISLQFFTGTGAQLHFANSAGWHAILSALNAASFIKPAVAGFLFTRLMTTEIFIVPQTRTLKIGAVLAFVGIFLPNLLLGFTQRHQSWLASGTHSYVYTYYSLLSAVVFSALLLAYMNVKSMSWKPKLRRLFIFVAVAAIMFLSFAVEVRNQYVAFDQKLAYRKWQLMNVVIQSSAFLQIPDGSTVVAPTLLLYRGIAAVFADDWSNYVRYKTGKEVQFVDNKCKDGTPCYSLVFRQEAHSDNQFIVLAKIFKPAAMTSSELTIYSMPNRNGAVLLGSLERSEIPPKLEINGVLVANIAPEAFSSNLFHVSDDGLVQTASVTGNADIIPERITISHYSVEPRLRPLSAELADGIEFKKQDYPDFLAEVSGMSGHESWGRWTDATIGPVAKFHFKQALPRKFTLEISANAFGPNIGAPVKVRVGSVEKSFVTTGNEPAPYRLDFETDGTADTLEIIPPDPTSPHELDPSNGDTRKLGLALIKIRLLN